MKARWLLVFGVLWCSSPAFATEDTAASNSSDWPAWFGKLDKSARAALNWSKEDLANYGKWDYKVETVATAAKLETQLNQLGELGWELVSVTPQADSFLLVLKKPATSYLSNYGKIPLEFLPFLNNSQKTGQ